MELTKQMKARARRLWDNYKLTLEDYQKMWDYQEGKCYVCGQPEPVPNRWLAVDHDHETGHVRGLLCSRCNPIIGKMERAFKRYGLHKVITLTIARFAVGVAFYLGHPPADKALGRRHIGYAGRTNTKAHRARLRKERRKSGTPQTTITRK